MSRKNKLEFETLQRNKFRKEAIFLNIRSPFRQSLYIEKRLKGNTIAKSLEVASKNLMKSK